MGIVEDSFVYALSSNQAWAGYKAHQNPDFFPRLATGQSPEIRKYIHYLFLIRIPTIVRLEVSALLFLCDTHVSESRIGETLANMSARQQTLEWAYRVTNIRSRHL